MSHTSSAYSKWPQQQTPFFKIRQQFLEGSLTPEAYLEECLGRIRQNEPAVKAWVTLNIDGARQQARASTERYRLGKPLSDIDGLPIGIKDLLETRDMPTTLGCKPFENNHTRRDNAAVRALREAGAIILGKTVTTALGFLDPGPTRNPFDLQRTPGGSSSGSAAAVGAGMVPVTLGTQLVASILRPASYCGNWALKPTFGAIHRGERQGFSQGHTGVHANHPADIWSVASAIVQRAGGDPGQPGLFGIELPLQAIKPARLAFVETEGWVRLDDATRRAFLAMLDDLRSQGIEIIDRRTSPEIEAFEQQIADATALAMRIVAWEHRWSLENLVEEHPGSLGPALASQLSMARGLTLQDARANLAARELVRQAYRNLAHVADAVITLASVGPAPLVAEAEKTRFPTGDVSFACVSSLLGAPATSVPVLKVGDLPVGVQVMGQCHEDARVMGISWGVLQALA